MTFPDQTTFAGEGTRGNCFSACLAGILGLKVAEVPHFALLDDHWLDCALAWIAAKGYTWGTSPDDYKSNGQEPLPYFILRGLSPRRIGHAVIGDTKTGLMVHDPHPSRAGLESVYASMYLFHATAKPPKNEIDCKTDGPVKRPFPTFVQTNSSLEIWMVDKDEKDGTLVPHAGLGPICAPDHWAVFYAMTKGNTG